MRFRLGGWAVAAVLALSGCGVDTDPEHASPAPAHRTAGAELVSARDTLPPAPPSATTLTVVLTHAGSATDPGLDAAAGALAQRPDIRVAIVVRGSVATPGATTTSGFPVTIVDDAADALAAASAAAGAGPDLVVVGIGRASVLGSPEPLARAAASAGVPALVVDAEDADRVDLAAAAMQLLEVIDLELDALLDAPVGVHRLTVPSCGAGTIRGRIHVRAVAAATQAPASSCTTTDRTVPVDEVAAVGAGYAALVRLP